MVRHQDRTPREAVDAPSLKCSRPGWMGLWTTWCGGTYPCPWCVGGSNQVIRNVPSNPNRSMILWFCVYKFSPDGFPYWFATGKRDEAIGALCTNGEHSSPCWSVCLSMFICICAWYICVCCGDRLLGLTTGWTWGSVAALPLSEPATFSCSLLCPLLSSYTQTQHWYFFLLTTHCCNNLSSGGKAGAVIWFESLLCFS